MEYTQEMEMLNVLKMEKSIRWHLQCDCYPPVPIEMIPVAMKAVIPCRENKFSENLLVPFEDRIGWMVPAHIVVETYHLEPWVTELEAC
jgi:hypothetical protein